MAARRVAAPAVGDEEGDVALLLRGGCELGDTFAACIGALGSKLHLRGWVQACAGGARVRVEGSEAELVALLRELRAHLPHDASLRSIEPESLEGAAPLPEHGFVVLHPELAGPVIMPEVISA